MSGIDLCRRVRGGDGINEPWDPDLPIIMLSRTALIGHTAASG
jgi:hypothetical protein